MSKEELYLGRKEFYNLQRKQSEGILTDTEEAKLIKEYVEAQGCLCDTLEMYYKGDDGRQERIIKAIAWWTPEQVRLGRRFVSSFAGVTDATFNVNERYMPLQVVYGVDNTMTTFPLIQAFITSESADTFRFIDDILREHFFWDCPSMAVIIGDFAKGLTAAVAQLAAEQAMKAREAEKETMTVNQGHGVEVPSPSLEAVPADTIVVDWVAQTEEFLMIGRGDIVILQRCEWHAVEAIKKRLIHKGYSKDKRNELVDLIWKWVKAPTFEILEHTSNALLSKLRPEEQEYLINYYKSKETSFVRYYTTKLPNLGMHSSQRGEQGHRGVKRGLSKNLPVHRSVEKITKRLYTLAKEVDNRINKQRESQLRLVDKEAFILLLGKVTHECLEKAMFTLIEGKRLLDDLALQDKAFEFDPQAGCQLSCEFPIRYGIPCKCWMAYFYDKNTPVPLGMFHPRWLYDGPAVLTKKWEMALDNTAHIRQVEPSRAAGERYTGQRFANRGSQLIIDTAFEMAEYHKSLPAGEGTKFAAAIQSINKSIIRRQD
jgi:hypothetical protein